MDLADSRTDARGRGGPRRMAQERELVTLSDQLLAESLAETIRDIRSDLSSDRSATAIGLQLPAMTREIDARLRENRRIVAQSPSVENARRS